MDNTIHNLDVFLAIAYFGLFAVYVKSFFVSDKQPWRFLPVFLPAILVIHLVKLIVQGVRDGHCPIVTFDETFSFTAFCLGIIYLIARRRRIYCAEGSVFIGLTCIFQFIAVFAATNNILVYDRLSGIPFGFHAPIALIGVAAFTASAIYGVLYITMFQLLKSKGAIFQLKKLPPLERVESMLGFSMKVGVVFFGFAITTGLIMGKIHNLPIFTDPKMIASLAVFAIFAWGIIGSKLHVFSGYRKSLIAILGFVVAITSMTVVRFYLTKMHNF